MSLKAKVLALTVSAVLGIGIAASRPPQIATDPYFVAIAPEQKATQPPTITPTLELMIRETPTRGVIQDSPPFYATPTPTVTPEPYPVLDTRIFDAFHPQALNVEDDLLRWFREYEVPYFDQQLLIMSLIDVESDFDIYATGPYGAVGIMQILPSNVLAYLKGDINRAITYKQPDLSESFIRSLSTDDYLFEYFLMDNTELRVAASIDYLQNEIKKFGGIVSNIAIRDGITYTQQEFNDMVYASALASYNGNGNAGLMYLGEITRDEYIRRLIAGGTNDEAAVAKAQIVYNYVNAIMYTYHNARLKYQNLEPEPIPTSQRFIQN